jgi:hypothetical protein
MARTSRSRLTDGIRQRRKPARKRAKDHGFRGVEPRDSVPDSVEVASNRKLFGFARDGRKACNTYLPAAARKRMRNLANHPQIAFRKCHAKSDEALRCLRQKDRDNIFDERLTPER